MTVAVIVNPAVDHGRAARRWARAYRQVAAACPDHVVWTTTGPGDGAALARRALERGYIVLVAVGGDGTLGEVVSGYLDAPPALRDGAAITTWPRRVAHPRGDNLSALLLARFMRER
jgi:diacylglycerol kinase family enzyme